MGRIGIGVKRGIIYLCLLSGMVLMGMSCRSDLFEEDGMVKDKEKKEKEKRAVPSKPNLSAKSNNGAVILEWNKLERAIEYRIYMDGTWIGTRDVKEDDPDKIAYSVQELENGKPYIFQVSGVNEQGEGPESDSVSAIPRPEVLNKPATFNATPGDMSVTLIWSKVDFATHYWIYRQDSLLKGDDDIAGKPIETVETTTYADTKGLTNDETYTYQVEAIMRIEGEEEPVTGGRSITIVTPQAPVSGQPTVTVAEDRSSDVHFSVTLGITADPDGTLPERYRIQVFDLDASDAEIGSAATIDRDPGNTKTTHIIGNLPYNTNLKIEVVPTQSTMGEPTEKENKQKRSVDLRIERRELEAPNGLSVAAKKLGEITLSWTDDGRATHYSISRSEAGGAFEEVVPEKSITEFGATCCSYIDSGLKDNTAYSYAVKPYKIVTGVRAYRLEGLSAETGTDTIDFSRSLIGPCQQGNLTSSPTGMPLLEYTKDFTFSSDVRGILNTGNPVVLTTYPLNEAEVSSLPYVDFLFSEEMTDSTLTTSGFTVTLYRNDTEQSGILAKNSVTKVNPNKNIYRLSFSNSGNLQHGDCVRIEPGFPITDNEASPQSIRTFLPYDFYINVGSEAIKNDHMNLGISSIEFSGSDNATNVTQPFFLPAFGRDHSSLRWETDRPDILQIDNKTGRVEVVRPLDFNTSAKLIAKITKSSETPLTKELQVTVPMLSMNVGPDSNSLKCSLGTPQTITDAVTDLIVIPKPNSVTVDNTDQFDITCNTRFASHDNTPLEYHIIGHLNKLFSEDMGFNIPTTSDNTQNNLIKINFLEKGQTDAYIDNIDIVPGHTKDDKDNILRKEEAYKLEITKDGILIIAAHKRGFINAYYTLIQLFPTELQKSIDRNKINTFPLPFVSIQDRPRLTYRGGHRGNIFEKIFTDVGERSRSIREMKKFISIYGRYKQNTLLFPIDRAIIEDPGPLRRPRIKIAYPIEKVFIETEQIRELVEYAHARNVDLIPVGHYLSRPRTIYDPDILVMDGSTSRWTKLWEGGVYSPSQETFAMFRRRIAQLSRLFGSRYIHMKGDEFGSVLGPYYRSFNGPASVIKAKKLINPYHGPLYTDDKILQKTFAGDYDFDAEKPKDDKETVEQKRRRITNRERRKIKWGNVKKVVWESERYKSLRDISTSSGQSSYVVVHISNQLVGIIKKLGRTPIAWGDVIEDTDGGAASGGEKHDPATSIYWWRNWIHLWRIRPLGHRYIVNSIATTYFENRKYIDDSSVDASRQHFLRCEDKHFREGNSFVANLDRIYRLYEYDVVDRGRPTLLQGIASATWRSPLATDNFDNLEYLAFPRIFGIAEIGWTDRPPGYPSYSAPYNTHENPYKRFERYNSANPYGPWENLKKRAQKQKEVLVNYDIKHFKPDHHGFLYETQTERVEHFKNLKCD